MALPKVAETGRAKALPSLHPKTVNNHRPLQVGAAGGVHRSQSRYRTARHALNRKGREPFSLEQLRAIFSAPLYTGCQDDEAGYAVPGPNRPRRGRFWVPLLGLWTGMRLNECCQLLVDDIAVRDGTDVIIVCASEDDEKQVKTEAGVRVVPIHPELRRLGFLAHVAAMRAAGERRLFPELRRGVQGNFSDPFQKWFSRP
jgi:integrase